MMPTMIIIPSSRKMTFQSMPACSEKKTSDPGTSPSTAITPAAISTTLTLSTFSVAMRTKAVRKMLSATMPVTAGALGVRWYFLDAGARSTPPGWV